MLKRTASFENLQSIYERVKQNISARGIQPEYPIGISGIDEITRGFPKGKVSVIASRSSEGKTSFAIQSAVHLANMGKNVAFISLEDDRETLVEKIACNLFDIDNYELGKGKVEVLGKYEKTINHLFERLPLLVLDAYGYNFKEFKTVVMELRPKPDIVFVDYLQVLEYAEGKQTEVISTFLRNAHQLALQEQIGMVFNSQINRGGAEAKRPHLHNMKQAGTIEEIAYLLLILHMNYKHGDPSYDYNKRAGKGMENCPTDYLEVMVEKNKIGRVGVVRMRFIGENYKFIEWI